MTPYIHPNATPTQKDILNNFSFEIIQQSSRKHIITILYKGKVLFRKVTNEISDYWDWIEFPEGNIFFPTCNLQGMLDFNVYYDETIEDRKFFNLTIYGFEDGIECNYQDFFCIGSVSLPCLLNDI